MTNNTTKLNRIIRSIAAANKKAIILLRQKLHKMRQVDKYPKINNKNVGKSLEVSVAHLPILLLVAVMDST